MRPLTATLFGCACLATLVSSPAIRAADGDLDPGFSGGTLRVLFGGDDAAAMELEVLADGRLLVAGTVSDPPRWAVRKVWESGAIDIGWSASSPPFDFLDESMSLVGGVYDLWRDPADGSERTMVLGSVESGPNDSRPGLARLTSSGELDPSFDGNGLKLLSGAPAGWKELFVNDGKFLPDGGSVFVGSCLDCPTIDVRRVWVAKFLASGAPDTGFSGDGWLSFTLNPEIDYSGRVVALYEDGRIVVACSRNVIFANGIFLARVTATGSFDGSFGGGDGITDPYYPGESPHATDVALDPSSGRIAVGRRRGEGAPLEGGLEVFTAAGLPDTTFSGDGTVDLDLEEGASVDSVAWQSDGKLLAVGNINANGAQTGGFFLARMTKTGALDSSFDGNGVKRVEFDAAANVNDAALAVTTWGGRLLAAGYAGAGDGDAQAFALVRTENAAIFSDGFERGTAGGWAGF